MSWWVLRRRLKGSRDRLCSVVRFFLLVQVGQFYEQFVLLSIWVPCRWKCFLFIRAPLNLCPQSPKRCWAPWETTSATSLAAGSVPNISKRWRKRVCRSWAACRQRRCGFGRDTTESTTDWQVGVDRVVSRLVFSNISSTVDLGPESGGRGWYSYKNFNLKVKLFQSEFLSWQGPKKKRSLLNWFQAKVVRWISVSPFDPVPFNSQLVFLIQLNRERSSTAFPPSLLSISLLTAELWIIPTFWTVPVALISLGTGLSLTARFVKSLSLFVLIAPLVSQSSMGPRQQGPEGCPSAPRTLKLYSTCHLHPSIFPGFLSPCPPLIPLGVPQDWYPPFDK